MTNRKPFFYHVRPVLFAGSLNAAQVQGLDTLLTATESYPKNQRAYILATAYHETARTMQPIAEYGKGAGRRYGTWRTNSMGVCYCDTDGSGNKVYTENEYPHLYYGRGYVQLTWLKNYLKAGQALCDLGLIDDPQVLAKQPNLAMQPEIAATILVQGMQGGWFTGRRLSDYLTDTTSDYRNARRIINGTDRAAQLADYAVIFEQALNKMDWSRHD